jgi:hypothetical protein
MRTWSLVRALLALVTLAAPRVAAAQDSAASQPISEPRLKRLRDELRVLQLTGEDGKLPSAESFTAGPRMVAAGTTHEGSVGTVDGDLHVAGQVAGDVIVFGGDVIVEKGGVVTGDALSVGGHVHTTTGGRVDGEMRSLTNALPFPVGRGASGPPLNTWQSVKLVVGCFAILFAIGVGVLMFAEGNLDGVVIALERSFSKAFWIGLLGQLLMLPVLLLLLVGLTLTVLGILLIPFAIVTYVIAAAGLCTLGFLAAARLTGSFGSRPSASERAINLRALLVGLTIYGGLWLLAALFTWQPLVATILRAIAIAVTWVAATIGLGAALASRAGTQRPGARARAPRSTPDDLAWQTPTPVSGVAAARRPVSPVARDQ